MPDRAALQDTLHRLHEQLEAADSLDEDLRAELREAMHEIRVALEDEGDEGLPLEGLARRLRELTLRFEGSHPRLAEVVGMLVDALARLGI
jgi:hypothetical protein